MSETTEPTEGTPVPAPDPTPTPAPEPPPSETEEPEPQREADEAKGGDKRFSVVTAKLSAKEREAEQLRQEVEFYRRQVQQQAPQPETPEQAIARIEREADARAEQRLLVRRFHEEGYAQYRDWDQKRSDLVDMGADAGIAMLLVEMPGGVRVAAALAEDPTELKRIADIKSERGRAIALGKFAATIDSDGATSTRPAPRQVTQAPAPIRPVTGRAAPQFNEYTADANTLAERYSKQALERRLQR